MKIKRSTYLMLLFALISSLMLISCSDNSDPTLYKNGEFPQGEYYSLDTLNLLPVGKIKKLSYFAIPIQFTDAGTASGNMGREFTGRVDHNAFIRLIDSTTDSISSKSVFKIIIPYPSAISDGSKYKFTTASPITLLSKEQKMDSDGKPFSIYKCIYQGYLTIKGTTYPGN
jgi:hypothetical protein